MLGSHGISARWKAVPTVSNWKTKSNVISLMYTSVMWSGFPVLNPDAATYVFTNCPYSHNFFRCPLSFARFQIVWMWALFDALTISSQSGAGVIISFYNGILRRRHDFFIHLSVVMNCTFWYTSRGPSKPATLSNTWPMFTISAFSGTNAQWKTVPTRPRRPVI